jgi:hypothetical protein
MDSTTESDSQSAFKPKYCANVAPRFAILPTSGE